MIRHRSARSARRGCHWANALVETALGLPLLLSIAVGLVAIGGVIAIRLPLASLARETARVMAEAPSYDAAMRRGQRRFDQVALGLAIEPDRLDRPLVVVTTDDGRPLAPGTWPRGGLVEVSVRYHHRLSHWPILDLADPVLTETARYPIQRYASR